MLRLLHDRRHREETGQFLIDGVRLIEEALRAGLQIERLLVTDEPHPPRLAALVHEARGRGTPVTAVAPHVLEAVSGVESPQGVVAVVARPPDPTADVLTHPTLLLLVADRVRDPGNLGTMIRTAAAAGVSAVALTEGTVDPYNPKVLRAAMGAVFHLPVLQRPGSDLPAVVRSHGVRVLGADAAGTVDYREANYTRPLAIVVGNEGEGLAASWREQATALVRIPILGPSESLNVAVAAGLLLYEAARGILPFTWSRGRPTSSGAPLNRPVQSGPTSPTGGSSSGSSSANSR